MSAYPVAAMVSTARPPTPAKSRRVRRDAGTEGDESADFFMRQVRMVAGLGPPGPTNAPRPRSIPSFEPQAECTRNAHPRRIARGAFGARWETLVCAHPFGCHEARRSDGCAGPPALTPMESTRLFTPSGVTKRVGQFS